MRRMHRTVRKTRLVFGEGETEEAFLKHVKKLYASKCNTVSCKIASGNGGSPEDIFRKACGRCQQELYEECYIVLDNDKRIPKNIVELVKRSLRDKVTKFPNPKKITCTPCIEGLFLQILGHSVLRTCAECKNVFHDNHMSETDKVEVKNYKVLFPLGLLEKKRKDIAELDQIILIFEKP